MKYTDTELEEILNKLVASTRSPRPFRAIYIEGNPVQKEAKPFKENEEHKVEIDDFGF